MTRLMTSARIFDLMQTRTKQRLARIRWVLCKRQPDLTLVLDNIHDSHNVSAILRSCDAFGVYKVHLYYTTEKFPQLGSKTSASAKKWVKREQHTEATALVSTLKNAGCSLLGTGFSNRARPLTLWDLSRPAAIVFGNEHGGISPELRQHLDAELYIPMQGMVQSLNVSVAAAVIMYEAWRQREAKGMYTTPSLEPHILEQTRSQWEKK